VKEVRITPVRREFRLSEVLTYKYEVINPPSNWVGRRAVGI